MPTGNSTSADTPVLAWDEHRAEGESIRLWAGRQERATLRYVNPRKPAELAIWNIWIDDTVVSRSADPERSGIVQAWWAWSGMRIDEREDAVLWTSPGFVDIWIFPWFDPSVHRSGGSPLPRTSGAGHLTTLSHQPGASRVGNA